MKAAMKAAMTPPDSRIISRFATDGTLLERYVKRVADIDVPTCVLFVRWIMEARAHICRGLRPRVRERTSERDYVNARQNAALFPTKKLSDSCYQPSRLSHSVTTRVACQGRGMRGRDVAPATRVGIHASSIRGAEQREGRPQMPRVSLSKSSREIT